MSEFINTIELLGDEAVTDSIIEGTITEFRDEYLTSLGQYAFAGCTALHTVDMPNVMTIAAGAFRDCTCLSSMNLSNVETIDGASFYGCGFTSLRFPKLKTSNGDSCLAYMRNLKEIELPSLTHVSRMMLDYCTRLEIVDLHVATSLNWNINRSNSRLSKLIIRTPSVCSAMDSSIFGNSCISNGTCFIYVPSALVDSYKSATNWSKYASQILPIEDFTIDGTVNGPICFTAIKNNLRGVTSTNPSMTERGSYETTLIPAPGTDMSVSVTMGGIDITESVYSNGVISIPLVTGEVNITAMSSDESIVISSVPLNGAEEGELPKYTLNVAAGQTFELQYYLTQKKGYLYDARGCSSGYVSNNNAINSVTTATITTQASGYITFSDYYNSGNNQPDGQLAYSANDRLYGKYLIVRRR